MRLAPTRGTLRASFVVALAFAIIATSGCSWFRRNNPYNKSAEARPLEVPPDLDRPGTQGAIVDGSTSVSRSTMTAPAAAAASVGFATSGERDAVFARVGELLAGTQGLTITSKAELLGVYDVNYEGSNFLVRVSKTDQGSYVSAVDPRGQAAAGEGPAKLIAALKAGLGG